MFSSRFVVPGAVASDCFCCDLDFGFWLCSALLELNSCERKLCEMKRVVSKLKVHMIYSDKTHKQVQVNHKQCTSYRQPRPSSSSWPARQPLSSPASMAS